MKTSQQPQSFKQYKNIQLLLFNIIILTTLLINVKAAIPTISPQNNLLNAPSNYVMNYFAFKQFQTTSFFQLDFSQSDIAVPEGQINVTATLNTVPVNQSLITSSCINRTCTIRLGISFAMNTNVQIRFGFLNNPKYTANQRINALIYIGVNSNETQSVTISSSVYQPMPVIVNSVNQSDYGVGSQDVIYTFNISFSYIPKDPQISIQIPPEVGYTYLDTQILFYGTVQNISPFLTTNIIILSLSNPEILNPNGFMLLKMKGFRNPRYIGTSSNFNVSMVQKKIATTNNCVTCRVAFLYANSSKLITVSSTNPGDIITSIFTPSSYIVSDKIDLTIGIKIVAPIPEGGKFRILLPSSITPVLPVSCQAIYGFSVSNPAYCVYNQILNAIQTVNFTIPYLQNTGDAIIKIKISNPKDNRQTQFNFQTLDDQNRKIGKSKQPYRYSAIPFTLNGTISKSITQLESFYTLSSSITLSISLDKSTDSILVVLPPSQFYNLSAIVCSSSSLDLGCSKTYDGYTKSLLLKFNLPCSVCNQSSVISFKITNLINPSFINQQMQTIQVQTVTQFGIVQSFQRIIQLKQKVLSVNSLVLQGNQQVGSQYKFKIQFQIPKYIQSYGGYLIINYNENEGFVDPILTSSSYQYPLSLIVVNQKNQSYPNNLIYYQNSKPYSLKQIKIKLCTTDSFCGSNLTIYTIRKAFYPLQSSSQIIKAVTLNEQSISSLTKDTSSFVPISFSNSLSINSTTSITNTVSNYVLKFTMNKVPFGSGLKISLSSQHKIQQNGRCFVQISPKQALGYGFDCQIQSSTSFKITYSGDLVMMSLYSIEYTITVVNVLNPPSIMPITYKIQTSLGGYTNGVFSSSYSIANPFSLVLNQLSSSNSTYGSTGSLSTVLLPGYYQFDELKIFLPKQNFKTFLSFNGINLAQSNTTYLFSQNSTHFILQKIFTIANNGFTIEAINALSTGAKGKITLQMYCQGFLSSKGIYNLPSIVPVYLYTSVISSNRFVGESTSLQFEIKRFNNFVEEKTLRILFDSKVLSIQSLTSGLYKSQSGNFDLFSYNQMLSSWSSISKNITLNSLKNMKLIPNNATLSSLSNIMVQTLDQNNLVVGRSIIDLNQIVPNKYKDSISYTFTRTLIESGNNTDLIIDFTARYPQKAKLLKIQLPLNENKLLASSTCLIGSSTTNECTIYSKTSTVLLIQYPQTQTRITLKNILNMFPSGNNLTLTLMTQNNQLIELSTKPIIPNIDYDPIQIFATVNSSDISSPVKLDFTLKSIQNDIQVGSKLIVGLPDRVYSKVLSINSKDCQYQIMGIKYSGCQYITDIFDDGKQWIQYVNVNNLGPTIIPTGSIIKLTLYLTNPWTAYTLNQKSIYCVLLNSLSQQISKGIVQLSSLYPTLSSFTPSTLLNFSISQSNKDCNSQNIISFNFQTLSILAKQTYLYITLPNALYDISSQAGLQIISNSSKTIGIKKLINSCSNAFSNTSGICLPAKSIISISVNVTNDKYLKITEQSQLISIYLFNDNNFVTTNSQLVAKNNVPRSIDDLALTRSNPKVLQKVTSNLKFTLQSGFNLANPLKISILPLNTTIKFMESISTSLILLSSNNQTVNSNMTQTKDSQILLYFTSIPQNFVQIIVSGVNPQLAPNVLCQSYQVKIYDDNYIYFNSANLTLSKENRILPIYEGIQISRSNSYVSSPANYSIFGSLTPKLNNARLVFNSTQKVLASSSISFSNLLIGQFTNPSSSNWNIYQSLSILNDTHILYSNNKIKANPQLQSLALPANTVKSIEYNKQMKIKTEQTVTINFNNLITNINKFNIKLPLFYKSLKQCKLNSVNILPSQNIKIAAVSQTRSLIEIFVTGSVNKIELTFITPDYQRVFLGDTITIETEYPTKGYTQPFEVGVYGQKIPTSFIMTSYKVNTLNNIQLSVTPTNKISIFTIYFPSFMMDQAILSNPTGIPTSMIKFTKNNALIQPTIQYNPTTLMYYISLNLNDAASLNANYIIQMNNIRNPSTNQQFAFVTEQSQISAPLNIFGHTSNVIKMNQLQPIVVKSVTRSSSKIVIDVQVRLQIQLPSSISSSILNTLVQKQCVIQLPTVQVTRYQTGQCSIYLSNSNEAQVQMPCKLHPTLSNAVITTCKSGNNQYLIKKGYKNMLYSVIPTQNDKPYVFIGIPYKMAESLLSKTDFLTPIYTSGSLNLHKITSSSIRRLQKTNLGLNLTLQNIQQVDCINLKFEKQNYLYIQSQIVCKANTKEAECWFSSQGSIMVNISDIKTNQLNLDIKGLVNYIRQSNFTIKTLKYLGNSNNAPTPVSSSLDQKKVGSPLSVQSAPQTAFGLIDIYYSSLTDVGASYESNNFNTRVINPQNYVSNQIKEIIVIFDGDKLLPTSLDKSLLKFNIQTNIQNCSLLNGNYLTTFSLKCKFTKSMKFTISVTLFDSQYPSYILSEKALDSYIYPELHSNCQNQMCDKCSNDLNGQQKCFSCRENYYQFQNGCVQNCPAGTASYTLSMSCQLCSSTCQTCYGIYPNNCLKCQNLNQASDNGFCTQKCYSGYKQNGYCLGDNECFDQGCRMCSTSGFCYECLPDYDGEPICRWKPALPATFMSYFILPFIAYALISSIYFFVRKGLSVLYYQAIFSVSILQLFAWVFLIPALYTKQQAILLISMIIFRIILGIVAYQTYYKKQINSHIGLKQEQSLLQKDRQSNKSSSNRQNKKNQESSLQFQETWVSKLIRFICHINGVDSYEQFKVLFSSNLRIVHNNLYLWLSAGNKFLVCLLMFYVLSKGKSGDLTVIPIIAFISTITIIGLRLSKSSKVQDWWNKLRNLGKN